MDPYFISDGVTIYHGDCRDIIATLPDASVDSIVTDPPYELSFMGKSWDGTGIAYNVDLWRDCLRVLKPGGHMLAFGSTRTYHRLACAIEDAGFEIRDSIQWIYGSGFPKSMNISKQIDKAAGVERERQEPQKSKGSVAINASGFGVDGWAPQVDTPITADAAAWQGWGTALKPAHEPIVLARKPIINTVTYTVLTHGTGGINIDATRIGVDGGGRAAMRMTGYSTENPVKHAARTDETVGRWPANVIHDGSDVILDMFPTSKGGTWNTTKGARHFNNDGEPTGYATSKQDSSTGSAARFFYCAKPSTAERDAGLHELDNHETPGVLRGRVDGSLGNNQPTAPRKNFHPTVKPIALMRYLCRLITPPGGTILEPFTGSGTTIAAAVFEGFNVIGCEMTDEYLPIIMARTRWAQTTNDNPNTKPPKITDDTPTLF
jgi:DNA modification methylase